MSISIDANSALSSAFSGMQASARVLDRAVSNISTSSVSAGERSSLSSGLPSKADGVRESATFTPPSMTQNIVDVLTSETLYTANAKVVEAVDGTIGTALNMLV